MRLICFYFLIALICGCGGGSDSSSENNNQNNSTSNSVSTSVAVADELTANQLESEARYNRFIDQVISPILSSEAYEFSIGSVKTLIEHQTDNPIKCFINETFTTFGGKCFDKNSYPDSEELWAQLNGCRTWESPSPSFCTNDIAESNPWISFDELTQDIVIRKPFSPTIHWLNLHEDKAIIFPLKLKLKNAYKEQMITTLSDLSEQVDQIPYDHLFPVCINNVSAPNGCAPSGGPNAFKNGGCLYFGACSWEYAISQHYDHDESYVIGYLDRSKKTEYFYDTKLKRKIAENDSWLLNMWYDFILSWNGLGNELSSRINRFYSVRITMKDSAGDVLKIVDFESAYPITRIKDECVSADIIDFVRIVPTVGFMAINKGSYTYRFLDQVIPVTHIPSLMTIQRDRAHVETSNCLEAENIDGTNNSPLRSLMTIIDELDFEVVIELDEITKNTSTITVELIYIENADYQEYS